MNARQNREKQPLRLLIVDGVAHTRHSLASFLQLQENLEVVGETAVAADALHLTQQLNPDVIIMGLNLLDMDGFSAAQQLRKLDPTRAIILLTIRSQAQDVKTAKAAGAIALIETSAGIDPILFILSSISSDDVEGK